MEPISIGCQVVTLGEDTVSVGGGTYTRAEVRRFLKGKPVPCRWCSNKDCGYTYRLLGERVVEEGLRETSTRTITNFAAIQQWAAKRSKR